MVANGELEKWGDRDDGRFWNGIEMYLIDSNTLLGVKKRMVYYYYYYYLTPDL